MRAMSPSTSVLRSHRNLQRTTSSSSQENKHHNVLSTTGNVGNISTLTNGGGLNTSFSASQVLSANEQNIRVAARIRPKTPRESSAGESIIVNESSSAGAALAEGCWPTEMLVMSSNAIVHNGKQKFRFDAVFPEHASQEAVFEEMAAPLVRAVCAGYNAALFAYGQTGTGKTHTMLGEDIWMLASNRELTPKQRDALENSEMRGVIPRAMKLLFLLLRDKPHKVSVSYLEIYNEKILDLLSGSNTGLEIREDKSGMVQVCDATVKRVSTVEEVFDQLWKGAKNRAVSSTDMNEHSSRSHTIFQVLVETKGQGNVPGTKAKLNLVDLAGSEKWRPHQLSEFSDQRIAEMTSINQSLSNLGNCVRGLLRPGKTHIPFRNSKLTRLLQDSLGGSSQCGFVVTVSPSELAHEETISTLQFADRVKRVQVKAEPNLIETSETLLRKMENELAKAREENKELKGKLDEVLNAQQQKMKDSQKKRNDFDDFDCGDWQNNNNTNTNKDTTSIPAGTFVAKPTTNSTTNNSLSSGVSSIGSLMVRCLHGNNDKSSSQDPETLLAKPEVFLRDYQDHLRKRKSDSLQPHERLALVEWALALSVEEIDKAKANAEQEIQSEKEKLLESEKQLTAMKAKMEQSERAHMGKVQEITAEKLQLQQELVDLKSKMLEMSNNNHQHLNQTRLSMGDVVSTINNTRVNSNNSSRRSSISDDVLRIDAPPPPPVSASSSNSSSATQLVNVGTNHKSSNNITSSGRHSLSTIATTTTSASSTINGSIKRQSPLTNRASLSTSNIGNGSLSRHHQEFVVIQKPSTITTTTTSASSNHLSTPAPSSGSFRMRETEGGVYALQQSATRSSMSFNSSRATPSATSSEKRVSIAPPPPSSTSSSTKAQIWDRFVDEQSGRPYYYCKETGETTWRRPSSSAVGVGSTTVIVRGE